MKDFLKPTIGKVVLAFGLFIAILFLIVIFTGKFGPFDARCPEGEVRYNGECAPTNRYRSALGIIRVFSALPIIFLLSYIASCILVWVIGNKKRPKNAKD